MAVTRSIREPEEKLRPKKEQCIHCPGGWIFEPTEDPLMDEAHGCYMCLRTEWRMRGEERKLRVLEYRYRNELIGEEKGLELRDWIAQIKAVQQ
jgi:hypothetical protein